MTENQVVDTLAFVVVENDLSSEFSHKLIQSQFYFTLLKSGDRLLETSVTFMIGIPHERLNHLLQLIHTHCNRRKTYVPTRVDTLSFSGPPIMIEAEVGGALIYIYAVERFYQF